MKPLIVMDIKAIANPELVYATTLKKEFPARVVAAVSPLFRSPNQVKESGPKTGN